MSNRQEWAHKCKGKASKNNIITEEDATGMATKTAMAEEVVRVANTKIKTNDMRKKRKVVATRRTTMRLRHKDTEVEEEEVATDKIVAVGEDGAVVETIVIVTIEKIAKTLIAQLILIKPTRARIRSSATKTGTTKGNPNAVDKITIETRMLVVKFKMINSLQVVITSNREDAVVMAEVIREVVTMMVDMTVRISISKIKKTKAEAEVVEATAIISKIATVRPAEVETSSHSRSKELVVELQSTKRLRNKNPTQALG